MDTFTLTPRGWFVRAFGTSPLVRATDRVEAIALLLAVTISLIAVPFAAAFGTAVHEQRAHVYAQQAAARHPARAVADDDSTSVQRGYAVAITVPVEWQAGQTARREVIAWDRPVKAGDALTIWLDRDGNYAGPPPSAAQAGIDAVGAAVAVWAGVAAACASILALLRVRLNRLRARAWEHGLRSLADH